MDLSNENVIHVKSNGIQYLQFRKLLEFPEIKHIYSLGKEDYRTAKPDKTPLEKNKYDETVKNYKNLCGMIGESYVNVVQARQTHSDNVAIVNTKQICEDIGQIETVNNTDSLITSKKNIILSTTNADCILLLLYDPVQKVIANVHSGWKGTLQRISVKTVKKMKELYNSNPDDIICCICPSIRKCHFEVDKSVKDMFENEFKDIAMKNIIDKAENREKWYIDTVEINKLILKREGLREESIIDSKLCSVCNHDLIHSFRVEKEGYGVATALIERE